MVLILKLLYQHYNYYVEECKDHRFDHFFLMGSPIKIFSVLAFYMYFVKKLGPQIMEHRKPFELNKVMIVYNFVQVIANFILPNYALYQIITAKYNFWCSPIEFSYKHIRYQEGILTYAYYMFKVVDLLDTVFFILRKKYNQASFLHLYHHMIMCVGGYVFTRYAPGGHAAIVGLINCYIHVIMYFYYLLTSYNSEYKKNIWWKKYITQAQLIQFAIITVYYTAPLLIGNCAYPKPWLLVGLTQNLFMVAMFSDFYYRSYIKKSKVATN